MSPRLCALLYKKNADKVKISPKLYINVFIQKHAGTPSTEELLTILATCLQNAAKKLTKLYLQQKNMTMSSTESVKRPFAFTKCVSVFGPVPPPSGLECVLRTTGKLKRNKM